MSPRSGLDETRFLKVTRIAPTRWVTGLVDLEGGRLLEVVADRTRAAVAGWLGARPRDWLAQVSTVALDPWRGYASALTARLGHATRDGFVVFHDLAVPGSPANVDHLAIGPTGLFVIDSKQWSGSVHQGGDGLVWHNHYRLDRTLETVRWEAETIGRLLGTRITALLCVHGAHVHGGGLAVQGVAIVPAHLLRSALGYDRVLSDADVALLAATARTSLRPAA